MKKVKIKSKGELKRQEATEAEYQCVVVFLEESLAG